MPAPAPSRRRGTAAGRDLDALPSPTAAKTLALLDLVARHPRGLTAAQASRASGITANLVCRTLKTLVARGYCGKHSATKTYAVSGRLLEMSAPKAGGRSLAVAADEPLRGLRDACGETVQLVIESAGKALVLEQVQGTQPLQVCGQVGMRVPLHSCAPGKAILAWWDAARRAGWYDRRPLKRFTRTTLADRRSLEADLAASRDRGYAIDRAEGIDGIHCVAAPVLDAHGRPLAAVTMMAPAARLPEADFPAAAARCMAAARAIEAALAAG